MWRFRDSLSPDWGGHDRSVVKRDELGRVKQDELGRASTTKELEDFVDDIFEPQGQQGSGDSTGHGEETPIEGLQMNIDHLAEKSDLVDIALDLMMYRDPKLLEAGFTILHKEYIQRSAFVQNLNDIVIFDRARIPEFKTALRLKNAVQLLRRDIESFELWGGAHGLWPVLLHA